MNAEIFWGIAGGIIGLIGGIIGSYFSIKNTNGPKEKEFAIRATLITWALVIIYAALFIGLPFPQKMYLMIPYGLILPLGVWYWNRTQQNIRTKEAQNKAVEGMAPR